MFENIINFFKKIGKREQIEEKSKDTAKERLHLVLMQDRANVSADFLDMMRQEIIEVIKKYIDVDEKDIDVRLTNKTNEDGTMGAPALYANIPITGIKEEIKKEKAKETNDEVASDVKKDEKPEEKQTEEVTEKVEVENTETNIEKVDDEKTDVVEKEETVEEKETVEQESEKRQNDVVDAIENREEVAETSKNKAKNNKGKKKKSNEK